MLRKFLVVALSAVSLAAYAEPQRAQFTHENKFPELHQLEVGALWNYLETDNDGDESAISPYARFGLAENLTFSVLAPYRDVDLGTGGDAEQGIGDVKLGVELLAWADIFEYPYVVPHVDVSLPTGDEDKGLGSEDTITTVGISLGTVTYDVLHWVGDVSYSVNGGRQGPDPDNIFIFALSLIWDVGPRFSVIGEGFFTSEDNEDGTSAQDDETPSVLQGGFAYKWTADFATSFYVGIANGENGEENGTASAKLAYSF